MKALQNARRRKRVRLIKPNPFPHVTKEMRDAIMARVADGHCFIQDCFDPQEEIDTVDALFLDGFVKASWFGRRGVFGSNTRTVGDAKGMYTWETDYGQTYLVSWGRRQPLPWDREENSKPQLTSSDVSTK